VEGGPFERDTAWSCGVCACNRAITREEAWCAAWQKLSRWGSILPGGCLTAVREGGRGPI